MLPWIKRTLIVVAAGSFASISVAAYTLAASDSQPRITSTTNTTTAPCGDSAGSRLQDPYQQAALRLITHGMLDGRMLPNSQLTVRLDQPMTGGDAMRLLVRALGKDVLARRLNFRAPAGATDDDWLKGALSAANAQMTKWGAPARTGGGDSILQRPMSVAESIALLMMAMGVEPKQAAAWPDNIIKGATDAGIIAAGDDSLAKPSGEASSGLVFYWADRAFYSYDLGGGKTEYTQYVTKAKSVINPYLSETTDDKVILSGTVTGSAQLTVKSGAVTFTFTGDGQWSAIVPLVMGTNMIQIEGTDTAGGHYVQDPPVIITRVAQ